jgi:hypothetical protein
MDQARSNALTESLTSLPSRRDVLRSLAGAGIALGALGLPGIADAKKKRRKKKKKQPRPVVNQFGCLDVGQPCNADSSLCCSGVCQGTAPKKGKPDTRRCAAHDTGTCTQGIEGVCTTPDLIQVTCNNRTDCGCFRTTGGSNYCAELFGSPGTTQCLSCQRDADCIAAGLPAGSACAPVSAGRCAGICSTGMACLVPCGPKPPGP